MTTIFIIFAILNMIFKMTLLSILFVHLRRTRQTRRPAGGAAGGLERGAPVPAGQQHRQDHQDHQVQG